jgi:hypothetical protein
MRKIIAASLFFIGCSIATGASATSEAKNIQDVTARVEQLRKALLDPEEAALKELSSTKLSYGHSGGHIEDQAEFIEKLVSGRSDFVTIDLQNQTISISGNVAIVRHTLNAKTKDKEEVKDISIGVMLIWQKERNKWKLVARQAFKLPTATPH